MTTTPPPDQHADELAEALDNLGHFMGTGCGTSGTNGCVYCFGPSPMSSYELAAALAPTVDRVVAAACQAQTERVLAALTFVSARVPRVAADEIRAALAVASGPAAEPAQASVSESLSGVTDALSAEPTQAARDRAAVEALRSAADAEEARCTGDWNGTTCDTCKATAGRLRRRAAALAGESDQPEDGAHA